MPYGTLACPPSPIDGILQCVYTPPFNFTGTDRIQYVANDGTTDSMPGIVTVTVQEQGLRWELLSNGTWVADNASTDGLADVIGDGFDQDFKFRLDWQLVAPRYELEDEQVGQSSEGGAVALVRLSSTVGYRFEGGGRFTLKQKHASESSTGIVDAASAASLLAGPAQATVIKPSDTNDLLAFEVLFQRNTSLTAVAADTGDAANRLLFRFMLTPELPGMSHVKLLLGLELDKPWKGGGSPRTRLLYGTSLPLDRLF